LPLQEKVINRHDSIVFRSLKEMPEIVISQGTVMYNRTGTWRYLKPVFTDMLPPCNNVCPAGNDIRGFIKLITAGELLEAWKLIKQTNPLPGVCGRVCPHPCEKECNRKEFDDSVSIHTLERFVADSNFGELESTNPVIPFRKERVAIIGSGPAGLSSAFFLVKRGYRVTVFEALPQIGGMLRFGIPAYRLPKDVLDKEIGDITTLGVTLLTGTRISDFKQLKDFQAIFVATGNAKSRKLNIPGEDTSGVISGIDYLRNVNNGVNLNRGKRTVVIGGGNTAIDAARSALRFGNKSTIVYRRTINEMPAIPEEINAARNEGIEFVFLSTPKQILTHNDKTIEIKFNKVHLGKPDSTGRKELIPVSGSEFSLQADLIITTTGEEPDLSCIPKDVKLSESGVKYQNWQIFGGGDVVTQAGSVVEAIASGKRVAQNIENKLLGIKIETETARKLVSFEDLNISYFTHQKTVHQPELQVKKRISSFDETNLKLPSRKGLQEAKRCFSCGLCQDCDNCIVFCPDIAVDKKDGDKRINYDYCKGCGICSIECPSNCISMVEEL